jgi:hypothetical protein
MASIEQERLRAQNAFAVQEGRGWCEEKAVELGRLAPGTVVVSNVVSGSYVTGTSRLDAMDKLHQALGKGTTLAVSLEVDRPVFIGGGIA